MFAGPQRAMYRRHPVFPDPEAALDLWFSKQLYWWAGALRKPADFTTFALNGSIFVERGLIPSATIDITLTLAGIWTSPGSYVYRGRGTSNPGAIRTVFAIDNNVADTVSIRLDQNTNNTHILQVITAGGTQAQVIPVVTTLNAPFGCCGSFDTNQFWASTNGVAGSADVSGALPVVTTLRLCKRLAASSEYLGIFDRLTLYDAIQPTAARVTEKSLIMARGIP